MFEIVGNYYKHFLCKENPKIKFDNVNKKKKKPNLSMIMKSHIFWFNHKARD